MNFGINTTSDTEFTCDNPSERLPSPEEMREDEQEEQWYVTPSDLPSALDSPRFKDFELSLPDTTVEPSHDSERLRKTQKDAAEQLQQQQKLEEETRQSMNLMGLGTIFVIGAVSANVFMFQRSRWAVGKEIHRAWQRRQAYNNTRRQYASSSSATANGRGSGFADAAREAAAKAAQAAARAAAKRAYQAAAEAAARAARQQRPRHNPKSEARWEAWGSTGPSSSTWHRSGRVAFDASDIDELLRAMRGESKRGSRSAYRGQSSPNVDELLDELFRSMSSGSGSSRSRTSSGNSFNMDQMFEEMMRAARQSSEKGAQAGQDERIWEEFMGRSGGNPFNTQNPFGDNQGVYTRGDFGKSRHYRTLGLEPGADMEAVKRAYRQLVMKWHPDRYQGADKEGAAQRFREITQAYEALTKNG